MRKVMILCFFCVVFAVACGTPPGKGKQGRVYAVVNGEPITEATLQKEVEGLPPYVRPILETPAGRAQFLESVITRDLLLREALRRGIDQRPEVGDRVSMARKSILLEALLRDVAEKAPGLGDEALRKTYNENAAQFQVGERAKVSHMLFRDKARAEEMYLRAKAGEPFEALMKEVGTRDGEVAADLGVTRLEAEWARYVEAGCNGAEACRRAGYTGTPATFRTRAYKLSKSARVNQYRAVLSAAAIATELRAKRKRATRSAT